jgi:transcriptional regulator with PAS, ATPase and Fis domain
MREVYQIIDAVAPSTASVLILGESGTGKELVARAVHAKSERAKGPFFALNCAALPKEILENELFGHEKGAFTGSVNEKPGAFEMASGGTILLDEIAEMSPDIQVKLLRALESRMVRRLGGKKEIPVDIRIVAATNKDLQKAIADGELREDLYYRLAVVQIDLPPLRERSQDIQLLATEFLARYAGQNGKQIADFDTAAWDWILSYHWPGNVRELKNAVERAVIMSRGSKIGLIDIMPRHLRQAGEVAASVTIPVGATVSDARRQLVLRTFASTSGDAARTARVLGVSTDEVQRDLLALMNSIGPAGNEDAGGNNGRPVKAADVPGAPSPPQASVPVASAARPASVVKKPAAKKR